MREGRLYPSQDDWYEWRQVPPLAGTVLVRVSATSDGRLVLRGLRIDGEPTAGLLRGIPVGRIEAAANAQLMSVHDTIVPRPGDGELPSHPHWRGPALALPERPALPGWEVTDPGRAAQRAEPDARRKQGRPDEFYRDLAQVYLDLARSSSRPAAELAEARQVPQTTAHRWIKEARRRGYLPPGRPGKAG